MKIPRQSLTDSMPKSSNDESVTRMSWWDHKGTAEWIQYDFPAERKSQLLPSYWYDDGEDGSTRVPESWRLLYKKKDKWIPVISEDGLRYKREHVQHGNIRKGRGNGCTAGGKAPKGLHSGRFRVGSQLTREALTAAGTAIERIYPVQGK